MKEKTNGGQETEKLREKVQALSTQLEIQEEDKNQTEEML